MTTSLLLTIVSASALTDLSRGKIYNELMLFGLMAGCSVCVFREGLMGFVTFFTSVAVALIILLPIYLVRGIGAGDVKLCMVMAPFLGIHELACLLMLAFLIGGVISICVMLFKRQRIHTIHFAVPILISTLFYVGGITII